MARRKAFDLRHQRAFPTVTALCFAFLYAPIVLLILYSFNASSSLTALAAAPSTRVGNSSMGSGRMPP